MKEHSLEKQPSKNANVFAVFAACSPMFASQAHKTDFPAQPHKSPAAHSPASC
jgi:hypothetical protein